jgi:hypothetical protein
MTDVVAEMTDVVGERTRLLRLRSLVMGGVATVALVMLIAFVLPHVNGSAPSAPRHAPSLPLPGLNAGAPGSEVRKLLGHAAAKSNVVKVDATSSSTHTSVSASSTHQTTVTKTESHVVSNVQSAPTNVTSHAQVQTSDVSVNTSGQHSSSSSSVIVSNNGSRSVSSGSDASSASDLSPMDVPGSLGLPSQGSFPFAP